MFVDKFLHFNFSKYSSKCCNILKYIFFDNLPILYIICEFLLDRYKNFSLNILAFSLNILLFKTKSIFKYFAISVK